MSATSANPPAKKRTFEATQKRPSHFSFPNHKVAVNRQRPSHDFSAVSNANVKQYYGHINTPKGGQRSGQKTRRHHSGQKTRRHCSRRRH